MYFKRYFLQAVQGVAGSVSGPVLGMFLLGLFFPCANWIVSFITLVFTQNSCSQLRIIVKK